MSILATLVRKAPQPLARWIRRWVPPGVECLLLEGDALLEVSEGRYDIAERHLLKALEIARTRDSGPRSHLGLTLFRVASFYFDLREFAKAAGFATEALAVLARPLSPDARFLPDTYELLAEAQFELGDFPSADETVRKALEVLGHRLSGKPGALAHQQWVFARLLFRQSRYDAAAPLYHAALRAYLGIEGPESQSVSQLVLELGNAQRKAGNCPAAIDTLEKALRTQEAVSGEMSAEVTPYLSLLGAAYADCGHARLAVDCFERALSIYERVLPSGHTRNGYVLFQLAECLNGLRRFHDAERMARKAVDILSRSGDSGLTEATRVLAAIKADRGQNEEADRLFSSALLMLERRVGGNHMEVADSLDRHAAVVWKLGRYEEAEQMMTRAQEIRKLLSVAPE